MSDDDPTPPLGKLPILRRAQSQTDRDLAGIAARREREALARATPEFVPADEDLTGNYKGEALRQLRSQRDPEERIGHLEERVDGVIATIAEWRAEVSKANGDVTGALGVLTGEVRGLRTVVETSAKREHITFKAQVDVETETAKENVKDGLDAKKARRAWITQGLKLIASALAIAGAAFAAGRC
jgi:hypothetical protein